MSQGRRALWITLLLKPALVIGMVALVDRLQHLVGIEPCFLTRLADALSGLTGISNDYCFAALIVLAGYSLLQLSRGILGLVE